MLPQASHTIPLILTHFRYTIAPSTIDDKKAKINAKIKGMRCAYLRVHNGTSFVRLFTWLDMKLSRFDVTEYEAAWRLVEFWKQNKHYRSLVYENISSSGLNAGM
jgi:Xaa-Pro aminopeptidase